MSLLTLEPKTSALVLIDLQRGISALPTKPHSAADVIARAAQLGAADSDVRVTKHQPGAFHGTDLDLQLRRRRIDTIVIGGISTNVGVESTARAGYDLGYNFVFLEDAMAALGAAGAGVPLPPNPLAGRARELAHAPRVFRSAAAPLLKPTCPPGVGKTLLAS